MIDLVSLDDYLSSDHSPEGTMCISDLDGFLTGVLCSPDLIKPSEWLPIVWRSNGPLGVDVERHNWATKLILERYNEISSNLNSEPCFVEPVFLQAAEGHIIAMDWCEGFMEAFHMRSQQWDNLLGTKMGQEWMFPILVHILDDDGTPIAGVKQEILDQVLDEASEAIPETIPNIYTFWKSKRSVKS